MNRPAQAAAELPRKKRPRTVRVPLTLKRGRAAVEKVFESSLTVEEAEGVQLVEHMARLYAKRLRGHVRYFEASEEAADKAEKALKVIERRDGQLREEAEACGSHDLTWAHLNALAAEDMGAALDAWGRVRLDADDERAAGRLAAAGLHGSTPMELARFYSVRDAFLDEWQPRGGIETAMIDMLAQTFALYLYWTQISHARAVGLCENLEELSRFESWNHKWNMPHEMARDSIEEAHRMADRYNRMFLRTLRQMRDLRRYPSVIVNNGGQVNVAQNQVNAQRAG